MEVVTCQTVDAPVTYELNSHIMYSEPYNANPIESPFVAKNAQNASEGPATPTLKVN